MIIRQLEQRQYAYLCGALAKKAHIEPMDACYTASLRVNDVEYALKLQPEDDCKIAALQAFRIDREDIGPCFALITDGALLSALLEILLYQGLS